ncbi:alpha/beta hydrolase [Nocardia farcinica]|uniref:Putative esterase n=1 Tax=Nocardia farcinica (strain IFM 10152) TaxID=247156 RepID=Q5YVB8_NOCFA|nr:putative esterase [Nocardia farcinica IFM 10152]
MRRIRLPTVTHSLLRALVTTTAVLVVAALAGPVAAQPIGEPHIVRVTPRSDREVEVIVHSAAMAAEIPIRLLRAADPDRPAPTLYLLNGITGGGDGGNWFDRTGVAAFFAGEQVNVAMPIGGAGSYFADWRARDPVLGLQRWASFLTRELPPLLDNAFRGTGANAVIGVSMAGTSVFQLALHAPGVYRAIGSFSGCVPTSDARGRAVVNTVVRAYGGDPVNLWGPPEDPAWAANDPSLRAAELRDTAVYVTAGTGRPGALDSLQGPGIDADPLALADQLLIGGALEAVAADCTSELGARLRAAGIPATVEVRPDGTHSWGYWEQDLRRCWPLFAAALAAPA